jgi:hypothetical protein
MITPDLKHCPICNRDLPISEFGLCRARRDGRNLYCKSCVREKVAQQRIALREYKAVRKQHRTQAEAAIPAEEKPLTAISVTVWTKLSPVERVREAIRRGARTQREIVEETGLGKDEVGDTLAVLILWNKEVRTENGGPDRFYFIREVEVIEAQPDRKDCVLSLSSFGPVMKHERVA